MADFTYHILEHIGTISTRTDFKGVVWTKEVNVVTWVGKAPKVDIREWANDHTVSLKGITLTEEEAGRLAKMLTERGNDESVTTR